jgi:DNA-binding NtrC family response regulator
MTTKARVLFLDDEERIVNLLRIMFRNTYEVFTATNGHDALKTVQQQDIHVVVSDQRMPEMTGIEFLTKVRQASPNTMRILLTGYSDLTAIVGSVNEGEVFRFINKPWNQEDITSIVGDAATIALSTWNMRPNTPKPLAAQTLTTAPRSKVLVLDDDQNDRHWVTQLFSKDHDVLTAGTIQDALNALGKHDIGVIVTEATVGGEDTGMLLKLLKRQYPAITAVMLTRAADSDLVIKLINQAQIFRFASKPIRKSELELSVTAAMRQHHTLAKDPALAARHKVADATEDEKHSPLAQSIMKGLSFLGARLGLFSRSHS